jgi:hypothetical protein
MQPRTIATLDQLEAFDWFEQVGARTQSVEIVSLKSWSEAMECLSDPVWENLCIEAANQYRERLQERAPDRFQQWNSIVEETKVRTVPLVRRKLSKVMSANNLPSLFEDSVQWDILHLCMEAEYADVYPPGFYASQAYWYTQGHFPCGWKGDFPKGKLVVF